MRSIEEIRLQMSVEKEEDREREREEERWKVKMHPSIISHTRRYGFALR